MNIKLLKKKYYSLSIPVKASIWYTASNVINKGISLLSTPIFTRILTEEQYGTFAIFQSWFSILIIFTSLNVFLGGYQKGILTYKEDIKRFTASQLGLTTTITIVLFVIYLLDVKFWTRLFSLPVNLMIAMFVELLFMPALELWSTQQRFEYKYRKYVVVTLLMSVIAVGGGALAVICSYHKLEARVYTDVLAKSLFAGMLFIFIFLSGKCFFDKEYWRYALLFNLPLIPHYLSNYVLNQSDRVMIGKMVGNTQAAYYSVAYTISTMMLLITSAVNNSLTPYIYKSMENNQQKEIKYVTKPVFVLVAGLCLVTMAFAPEIIKIFAGKQYLDAIYVIPPIAAAVFFIFLYSLFSNIEYYFQKTGFIAIATCLSAIINLFLNYYFIKKCGYYAAGYTTLVCYICLAVFHYVFYKRTIKENNLCDEIYDTKIIGILSILVIAIMIIMAFTYQFVWIRYVMVFIIILFAVICRKKIMKMLSSFKEEKE